MTTLKAWINLFVTVLSIAVGFTIIAAVTWRVCGYIWAFITT